MDRLRTPVFPEGPHRRAAERLSSEGVSIKGFQIDIIIKTNAFRLKFVPI